MDKSLINALIIIAVVVGVYYYFSPYEKCMRLYPEDPNRVANMRACKELTRW
ncbi:MAG: hypothetical protein ACJZ16_04815 [Methylophilaceae bacterium]